MAPSTSRARRHAVAVIQALEAHYSAVALPTHRLSRRAGMDVFLRVGAASLRPGYLRVISVCRHGGGVMMAGGERILVAAAPGQIIESALAREFPEATMHVADGKTAVELAVIGRVRFDVVISDLTWNDHATEFPFDGLDVLDILSQARRPAPVIFATLGHWMELDYLDEAAERAEVAGIYCKATGTGPLFEAVRIAVDGRKLPPDRFQWGDSPPGIARIHRYFGRGRGFTAARMAGAIASGRAVNRSTLARAAMVSLFTAARLVDYLGPLISGRGEHDSDLKITPEVVYMWCGEHRRYILSWCRRKGLLDAVDQQL